MGRSRVRSFISSFGGQKNNDSGKGSRLSSSNATPESVTPADTPPRWQTPPPETASTSPPSELSPVGSAPRNNGGSRPASMVFSRNPPLLQQANDTPPELSPIFSFLNIHTNKVYQEGYFLKLNDLDSLGRPSGDRQWVECYAQLVGTVLSLWDGAALDAAGGEEVPATFINLADASIKMIETLPIRNGAVQPLKNVLSLSSAGKNRYLLHFNSFHSLTQWTAAIRLALFEHTSLYEAYTGSLIAAKGRTLNGINTILVPTKFKYEDWARVRFGAGTPWRRCWFVISPPDEKEMQKARKIIKKSAYDRLSIPVTGNIKFYETKKTKKVTPIATITNVYSAYAIYPQSKALIDASTLVKLEGRITTHADGSSKEGLVFVMPELHAAVSGFEMMLRFLFPTFDTFNLYGRPTRLVADTNHIKSIMFAFPKERRYGYLDVLDIASLLQTPGSQEWSEAEWRKQLKAATQRRISAGRSRTNSVNSSKPRYRSSMSGRYSDVPVDPRRQVSAFQNKPEFNHSAEAVIQEVPRIDGSPLSYHTRGFSDTTGFNSAPTTGRGLAESSPNSSAQDLAPRDGTPTVAPIAENSSSDSLPALENGHLEPVREQHPPPTPPSPVMSPPAFSHGPREMPANRPEASSEQRLQNNRMSHATLSQLTSVGGAGLSAAAAAAAWKQSQQPNEQQPQQRDPNNIYHPSHIASNNSLAHSSSDESMTMAVPVRPPKVPEHRPNTTNTGGPSPQRSSPQRVPIDTSKSVRRKPVPQRDIFADESQGQGEPSYDDLRHTLDEDVLNQIAPHLPSPISSAARNDEESVYDDASTVSPDYASTHGSVYSKNSTKSTKPRMGVMKTVGVPAAKDLVIGDARYTTDKAPTSNPDIPNVDFGPTMTYMPTTGRPSTGDALKKPLHQRRDSEGTKLTIPTHQMDQANGRPSSQEEYRRSMLWQPGMASGRPVTPGGLTPEQYVQQRAAPSPPMHMHNRTPSGATMVQRPVSGDWAQLARSSSPMNRDPNYRSSSPMNRDPNYRPSSRGATSMLNHNDASIHLSAREQEHVARMTGSSFFNMNNDTRKPHAPVNPGGLVSAIDAREREKREMKEGMSNQMVQQAIAHRQQHMMHQQQYAPQPMLHQSMSPQQAASVYPPQHGGQASMYNMPVASHTWDALNQMNRPDEPRRSSWYGQLSQQTPQAPSVYPQSQHTQNPGFYGYAK
ncbi:hypothetical protein N7508_004084 [Penicillium antarcticum]|nr:uncharacterized protein N7508_004084 [Penicillium antarcticum]KAJ5308705.1 hypothetical protein N7508_004084 [Penicillium antarcticum]